jgi:hypothetical protein
MILMIINIETLLDRFNIYHPKQLQILMALPLPFLPLLLKVLQGPLEPSLFPSNSPHSQPRLNRGILP